MAWKEVNLISDLSARYFAVDSVPTIKQAEDSKGITWLSINVFEKGLSQQTKVPTGFRKNVEYYVFHRGQADEQAWYNQVEPVNSSNTDVTVSTSAYGDIANIYNSKVLQDRVLAAIITQCSTVFQESSGTANHVNRMKLVSEANISLPNVVMRFMSAIAINATVQAQGTSVSDAVIQSIVTNSWNSYASLIVA